MTNDSLIDITELYSDAEKAWLSANWEYVRSIIREHRNAQLPDKIGDVVESVIAAEALLVYEGPTSPQSTAKSILRNIFASMNMGRTVVGVASMECPTNPSAGNGEHTGDDGQNVSPHQENSREKWAVGHASDTNKSGVIPGLAVVTQSSKISAIEEGELINLCGQLADIVRDGAPYMGKMAAKIRPYLATRKPVSVSLEKCENALIAALKYCASYSSGTDEEVTINFKYSNIVPAVLDATGVKYE